MPKIVTIFEWEESFGEECLNKENLEKVLELGCGGKKFKIDYYLKILTEDEMKNRKETP